MEKQFLTELGIADDIADQIITQAATEVKASCWSSWYTKKTTLH